MATNTRTRRVPKTSRSEAKSVGRSTMSGPARPAAAPDKDDPAVVRMTGTLFDALAVPDGPDVAAALMRDGHSLEFLKDQFRRCKALMVLGSGKELLATASIVSKDGDSGVIRTPAPASLATIQSFITAIAKHRHYKRDADPPPV